MVGPHEPSGHPIEPRLRRDPGEIDVQQPRLAWGDGPDELHELMRLGTAVDPGDAGWIQEGPLRLACPGGVVLDIPETRSPSLRVVERLVDAVDFPVADDRQKSCD